MPSPKQMQTSHLAPKIREERDRFRIEADKAISEYDALAVDVGILAEALNKIEVGRPNRSYDPWAQAVARDALLAVSDRVRDML